jgi:hypothetical protein
VKRVLRRLLALSLLASSTGCAAAQMSPAASPPPPEAAVAPAPSVVAVPPASPVISSTAGASGDSRTSVIQAREELMTAQHAIEASTGNCIAACRALGSMDRAAGQLCGLASSAEEAPMCNDAMAKLIAARQSVRAACGACPGGPSTDPRAPVPSR